MAHEQHLYASLSLFHRQCARDFTVRTGFGCRSAIRHVADQTAARASNLAVDNWTVRAQLFDAQKIRSAPMN